MTRHAFMIYARFTLAFVLAGAFGPRLLPAADLDLATPAMKQLKSAYEAEKLKLEEVRKNKLKALLEKKLDEAKALLKEKTRSGNITGMAVGRKAVSIFEDCLAELEEKGDFELPERVRRELRKSIEAAATGKEEVRTEYAAALETLDATFQERMSKLGLAQGVTDISVDEIAAFFKQLTSGEAPPTTPATEAEEGETPAESAEGDQPAEGEGAEAPPPAEDEPPKVVATSGEGGSDWVTIARWYAAVSNIEIVRIPIVNRTEREHKEVQPANPLGQPYEVTFEPIRMLSPGPGYKFQLKSLPGREAPDIVAWPSERNNWTLEVRARPTREVPSKHGVEIQVSFPGSEALPLLAGKDEDGPQGPDVKRVTIAINTLPDGAFVFVDGRPYREGTHFLKTPCRVPVPEGKRNIRLRMFGFKDAVIADFMAEEGKTLSWRFEKDESVADETVSIPARSAWRSSKVDVKAGDTIYINAEGAWSCASGKEMVDAEGYPNNKEFYKYYLNPKLSPRQLARANYGALIMRIGRDGEIIKVGKAAKITAERDGVVHLDINEADDVRARRDNNGSLTVRVRKIPGQR